MRRRVHPRPVGLALAGAVAALLAAAPPAGAGVYTVETCSNGSISGWSHFTFGDWASWGNWCGTAGLQASVWVPAGSSAGWTFTAPADTEIAGFRLTRSYSLPANRPYGTGVATVLTEGPGAAYFEQFPNFGEAVSVGPEARSAAGLRGQRTLAVKVDCGGGAACTGPGQITLYGASIDLRDDFPPALGTVAGPLLAGGPVKGTRALSFAAGDRGGGIRREVLTIDGATLVDRLVDCSYALVVPCPPTVSGTLAVDTTRLSEGEHEIEFGVYDATLGNPTTTGPLRIMVDNVPAPMSTGAPRIYGTAARDVSLSADDGSWAGTGLAISRRWQRREDGVWEDIAGASQPAYTPTADDVGRRLRVRVRASNAEGTTDAFSEPTAVVTATPAAASSAPVATAAPAAPAPRIGIPSAAFAATGRVTISLPWGQTRRITGALLRPDGRPLAGEHVTVTSRVRALDAPAVSLGQVTTDGSGRFAYTPVPGVSRTLSFGYGHRSASVTLRVTPKVALRFTGGRLEGRVSGAPAGSRTLVDLQAPNGHAWRTFATTRLAGGRFAIRVAARVRKVRVVVRADAAWPFLTATSEAAKRS